jgi:O-antigen/teichoic acid export membrane protein
LSVLKKLAGQTAIYGLSSIVGRLLNYLLVPIYTSVFIHAADYGVVSELYAYVAFLIVFLTFGMETTFFRFLHQKEDKKKVFNAAFLSVALLNIVFLIVLFLFHSDIAATMLYADHPEYILLLACIVSIDAICALPLAKLRAEEKAKQFALVQLSSIFINIALNLVFLFCFFNPHTDNPAKGILFIFIANLAASLIKPLLLFQSFRGIKFKIDFVILKEMLHYAWPIVIAGFAGIINEVMDRILLKHLLNNASLVPAAFHGTALRYAEAQVGIYSANYKLAMLVSIFLQAFRYAAEPFFFAQAKSDPERKIYAKVMNYLIAILCLCFLGVCLNIDLFKHFISRAVYYQGLKVVPILLLANIFLGIYMSQSIWYKLSGQTKFGAYISIFGAISTLVFLVFFIPKFGYIAAAWTTMGVYAAQMLLSFFLGQKHYPIPYNLKRAGLYFSLSLLLFFTANSFDFQQSVWKFLCNNLFIVAFIVLVWYIEKPMISNKYFKK